MARAIAITTNLAIEGGRFANKYGDLIKLIIVEIVERELAQQAVCCCGHRGPPNQHSGVNDLRDDDIRPPTYLGPPTVIIADEANVEFEQDERYIGPPVKLPNTSKPN